ncbi:MAG: hypothetical protein MJ211_15620 [Bacteroidales bacterium]|nr:hypothetical protein [Bacteroidales bacterium]
MKITYNGKEYEVDTTNSSAMYMALRYAINYHYPTDLKTLCKLLVELYVGLDKEDELEEILSAVKPIKKTK